MFHLLNHTTHLRGIGDMHRFVDFGQPHTAQHDTMLLRPPDHTANEPHSHHLLLCHLSILYVSISSRCFPRMRAISRLLRSCFSPSSVAFTTLCGLFVPRDLVNTSATPTASIMARTGPPAMMPVPRAAGLSN